MLEGQVLQNGTRCLVAMAGLRYLQIDRRRRIRSMRLRRFLGSPARPKTPQVEFL